MIQTMFNVGNIFASISTIFLIIRVIQNRNSLKGYSLIGALGTAISLIFFNYAFIIWRNWISVVFSSFTFSYWTLVTIYLGREKIRELRSR